MALEDQLLENFRQLPPEERQNLVAFSRRLVHKSKSATSESMSQANRQKLLEMVDGVTALSSKEGPEEDGSVNHDLYLYGSP
ncbi:MAG: hypothetical protein ACAI44_13530 [Candidatus Sericytochromatia bacterium]